MLNIITPVYTRKDWQRDRVFSARPGQLITEEIYDDMLNCMPPYHLPEETRGMVSAGFLMGEPAASDQRGALYHAFGSKSGKHIYLGLYHRV